MLAAHTTLPVIGVPIDSSALKGIDAWMRTLREDGCQSSSERGADWIKVYADYRWGPDGEALPTFSQDELRVLVETARGSGRPTAAHATTSEGMRRAVLAGVETIEHGDGGTTEVFRLMRQRGIALCPTIAASEIGVSITRPLPN